MKVIAISLIFMPLMLIALLIDASLILGTLLVWAILMADFDIGFFRWVTQLYKEVLRA